LDSSLHITPRWLAGLTSLTSLELRARVGESEELDAPALVIFGLGALAALRHLSLAGRPLAITDAILPPGLASLVIYSAPKYEEDDGLLTTSQSEFIVPEVGA
jgi:hypothetical protein